MLTIAANDHIYSFRAMASPCEVRVDSADGELTRRLGEIAEAEALRIEAKYSRYRSDSALSNINTSGGLPVEVDDETAILLDYAANCHRLSEGRFDITSGVLRRVWKFDGSDRTPTAAEIKAVLPLVGWGKVTWRRPFLTLPAGMEIDFGGLGKEYAVDAAIGNVRAASDAPVLVNFGGDLRVTGPRANGARWRIGIESVEDGGASGAILEIIDGALTTSGDARRFLLKDGVRYSHILDPRTGWPVKDPPRSVTVAAATCLEAGILSTLAMLHGRGAERFLKREGLQAWWVR
jgi:thiamine biosynthesis lipoprotein